jgi:hypothetical protein
VNRTAAPARGRRSGAGWDPDAWDRTQRPRA